MEVMVCDLITFGFWSKYNQIVATIYVSKYGTLGQMSLRYTLPALSSILPFYIIFGSLVISEYIQRVCNGSSTPIQLNFLLIEHFDFHDPDIP